VNTSFFFERRGCTRGLWPSRHEDHAATNPRGLRVFGLRPFSTAERTAGCYSSRSSRKSRFGTACGVAGGGHMQGLTKRQERTLDIIRESIERRGYPPTLREIGEQMGIRSTNGVNDHLRALERKGHLRREDMKSRALQLVDEALPPVVRQAPGDGLVDVPVLSRICSTQPLLAEENIADVVRFDRLLLRTGSAHLFGLRMSGDSMIEAGILSGDYVFAKKQQAADRGDIVVALVGDEATVKYFYPERDYVRFQPANEKMAPMLVRATDFRPSMLVGKVIGVWRNL
jgi:repressor LexA